MSRPWLRPRPLHARVRRRDRCPSTLRQMAGIARMRSVVLGATKSPEQPSPAEYRVFLDPAGHPFCLCI
jgi:hypothetical protein